MIPRRLRRRLASPSSTAWAVAAALLLSAPSLFAGLQGDDFIFLAEVEAGASPLDLFDPFRFAAEGQGGVATMKERGELPWWVHDEARLRFFRPITSLSHYLDFALWPRTPWVMRVQNLAWYAWLVILAGALYRRLCAPAWAAGLALLLYAIDDCHAQSVGWITARNTLMGAAIGLAAVVAHVRWREEGWRAGRAVGPALFAAALLSAEGSLALGGYLVAFSLVLDRGSIGARLARLWPYLLIVVGWRLYYVSQGYGVFGLTIYRDPAADLLGFLVATLQNGVILSATQLTLPVALPTMAFKESASLLALGVVALVALGLVPTLRRDRRVRFWALGMLLSTAPFGAVQPTDRLLFPVGLGAFAVVASFVTDVAERRVISRPRRVLAVLLLLVHLALAPVLFVPQLFFAGFVQGKVDRLDASIPAGPEAARREVVIVQMPEAVSALFLRPKREVRGLPVPAGVLTLYAGESSVLVERIDEDTLELRPRAGFLAHEFEALFRSAELPFEPGKVERVGPMIVEVTSVTSRGRPRAARFHFPDGLERPHHDWRIWRDGRLRPWSPPRPGETVRLAPLSPI